MRYSKWTFLFGAIALAALVVLTPRAAHALVAALVQVTNTTANPVITSTMDDPGRIPYAATVGFVFAFACHPCTFSPVPANHRLVIQHVTVNGTISGPGVVQATVFGDQGVSAFFVPTALTGGAYTYAQDEPVLQFISAGEVPQVSVFVYTEAAQPPSGTVSLFGYLLDCAAAPCSAFTH